MNAHGPDQEGAEEELAKDTVGALRKRTASNAVNIRVEKRSRHEHPVLEKPLGNLGSRCLCSQDRLNCSCLSEEDDDIFRAFESDVAAIDEYKASHFDPTHASDPGFDQFYGISRRKLRATIVVEEPRSYILCDSPQEALTYFKTNEKEVRRRIKHIIFSLKAMASGISHNGMYWKGLCNYMRKYMCVESIMIPVPYDPVSAHVQYESSEDGGSGEETTADRLAFESLPTLHKTTFPPPELLPSESSVLAERRRAFDWKILSHLSRALTSGYLKEIRLNYPVSFPQSVIPDLKVLRAIHKHTQEYATEKRRLAILAGNVEPNRMRAQYAFNLTTRASAPVESAYAVAVSKVHYSKTSHPRLSLLGLPREMRDRILELAVSTSGWTSLHIMDFTLDHNKHKRIQMKPSPDVYLRLRLVSRQIQLESSPFLFKDKTLVLACDAKEAYRYLIRLPTDTLKHIKKLRLHERILHDGDEGSRHAWPRFVEFIARQIPLQEMILHAPSDPSFPGAFLEEGEATVPGDENGEKDAEEVERRRIQRCQALVKDWHGYWWPGARLAVQLLLQKRIAKCIKLRHEAKDYFWRCKIHDPHELQVVTELSYAYDRRLDQSDHQLAVKLLLDFFLQSNEFTGQEADYKYWYKEAMMRHPDRKMLHFDISAGMDDDGYQVIVITRKKELGDAVLLQGQQRSV
ncbi:hypothetical protein FKW77_001340 [Venturia effusa]|uniref:Uncharacterized protein n=1 Tax=Venturia effusa TaxID=50376 RepID=A0A517LPP4_9PEZI|nr:hypothetical protein FKW77_001340 [Venturia effusa]